MCFHYDLGSADLLLEVNFWFATKTGFGLENSFNLDFKNHVYKCENAKQYRPTPEPKSFVKNKKKNRKKERLKSTASRGPRNAVKHGDGGIMLWWCFSSVMWEKWRMEGRRKLAHIYKRLDVRLPAGKR